MRPSDEARSSPPFRDGTLLLTAAHLYYVDDQSQDQVARQLSVSRSTVSRLLAEARAAGVVKIEIIAPPAREDLRLELERELGLDCVYIAPGIAPPDDPGAVLAGAVGEALLESHLRPGDALLVSWGRAMWSVSRADLPAIPGVVVVPALGGLSDERPWVQTNEIARQLAARLQCSLLLLHAPAVPSSEIRASLLTDDSIRAALSRWDDASAMLVGIEAGKQEEPRPSAILSMQPEILEYSARDVAACLSDSAYLTLPYDAENPLLGISREQLIRIPRRIAVAVGVHKTEAMVAAARLGLVNVLVTDVVTASALMRQLRLQ